MRAWNNVAYWQLCLVVTLLWDVENNHVQASPSPVDYRVVNNWNVDGQHGILRVRGSLTDSPCRLVMESQEQTIELGTVGVGELPAVGSEGRSVPFQLELTDCLAVANARMDRQTGQMPWSVDQPGVSVRFLTSDVDGTGRYVQLHGISGIGLVIKDSEGQPLTLGQYSSPRLLPVGQSVLNYTVTPVRVASVLSPGAFYAVMGVQLSYD